MGSPLGRKMLQERKVRIEGVFALVKGAPWVETHQIQLWMTAAAMNIKKAIGNIRPNPRSVGAFQLLAQLSALLPLRSPFAPSVLPV